MPIYRFICLNCGIVEPRIGGVDDVTATCVECKGGLMGRLDVNPWEPYFEVHNPAPLGQVKEPVPGSRP